MRGRPGRVHPSPASSTGPASPARHPRSRAGNRRDVTTRRLYPYQCHIAAVRARPRLLAARRIKGHREMHRRITVADVEVALAAQGTELRRGDILLLRTGIFRVFYEDGPEAFYADFDEPGLTWAPGLIEFVAEHDIAGLGSDTMCNE